MEEKLEKSVVPVESKGSRAWGIAIPVLVLSIIANLVLWTQFRQESEQHAYFAASDVGARRESEQLRHALFEEQMKARAAYTHLAVLADSWRFTALYDGCLARAGRKLSLGRFSTFFASDDADATVQCLREASQPQSYLFPSR